MEVVLVHMLYGDFFEYKADGVWYNIFSDKTNYDWYLIVCVKRDVLQVGMGFGAISVMVLMIVLMLIILAFVYYLFSKKEYAQAESIRSKKQLEDRQTYMHHTLSQIKDQMELVDMESSNDAKQRTSTMEVMAKLGLLIDQISTTAEPVEIGAKIRRKKEQNETLEQNEARVQEPVKQQKQTLHTTEEFKEVLTRLKEASDAFYSEDVLQICEELQNYTGNSEKVESFIEEIRKCAEDFNFMEASEKAEEFLRSIQDE